MATATKVVQIEFREDGSARVVNGIKKMGNATNKAKKEVNLLQKAFLQIGGILAFTAALKGATTAAINFGAAMAEVKTLLDDTSQFDNLTKSVTALSLEFGKSPTEEAKALYQVVSAGAQDAAKAVDILTVSNKLAVAGVTEVNVAADALTTVMNSFGDEVGSAISVSDAFFVAVKAGKTTVDELARGIGEVSGVAANVGVSFEEVLAATSALTLGTLNTAKSMRGLRGVMQAIFSPTEEAREVARILGIEFNAAGLQAKGLTGFLKDLSEKTGNSTFILGKLFGNIEGLLPVMALGGSALNDFNKNLDAMADRAGKTDAALEIMKDTAKFKLNRALVALTVIGIKVGNILLTVIAPAAEFAAENMDILTTAMIGFAGAIVAIKWAAIVSGVKSFALAIKGLTVAIMTNPIGLIAVAVAALTIALIKLNEKFMIFEPTWIILRDSFLFTINSIRIGLNKLLNWVDSTLAGVTKKLIDFQVAVGEIIAKATSVIGTDEMSKRAQENLSRLKEEQANFDANLQNTLNTRIETNKQLDEENKKLTENLALAKEQLFTERQKVNVKKDELGGAGGVGGGDSLNDKLNQELAEQERRAERLLILNKRAKELTIEMRTPQEIFNEKVKELNEIYEAGQLDLETYNRAMKKYQEEMGKSSEATDEFMGLIEKAINGTLTAKDLFMVAVKQILRGLTQMNQGAQDTKSSFLDLAGSIGGGGGGGSIGGIIGQLIGSFITPLGAGRISTPAPINIPPPPGPVNPPFTGLLAANGAAFNNGIVQKFQKGGIVSGPTAFPMRGGMGLMGEKEEEAIMPLQRGSNGRLGVSASGFSQVVNVNVIDQRSSGEPPEVKESVDSQGNKRFSIIIQDEVNRGFAAGRFDNSMKLFGVLRGGNRR